MPVSEGGPHDEREYACRVSDSADATARDSAISDGRATESKADLDRAFERLYRDHLRDVYSYSYYRVGNHHDAEDVTEQAFLQAYRHFERAQRESNGRPLRPWLIRIAHNLASNYHRDRARRQANPGRKDPDGDAADSDAYDKRCEFPFHYFCLT
jgi:DNA-directed RNA polymerase specialized sigma24 family protein